MDFKNLHEPKLLKGILIGIAIVVIIILIFQAGVFVGYRKAAFSYRLGDNYYRTFKGTPQMKVVGLQSAELPGGHGAVGKVVRIDLPELTIAENDNVEKTVLLSSSTMIKRFDNTISPTDILIDDFAVVLGSPDDTAQIHAKFVRLMPPPIN